MARVLACVLLLTAAACGRPHASDEGPERGPQDTEPGTTVVKTVSAAAGGEVKSTDGDFWLVIPPGSFDQDIEVTLKKLTTSPAGNSDVSDFYRASHSPDEAQLVPFAVMSAVFKLDDTEVSDVGDENLAVGFRAGTSGDFDEIIFGLWDDMAETYTATTGAMGDFQVVDVEAYESCSCDTTSACNAGCASCDPDCDGGTSNCTASQWECDSGQCIPDDYYCDGVAGDCSDGSDEDNCGGGGGDCGYYDWQCDDGGCIDYYSLCDGNDDCDDGSDESVAQCGAMPEADSYESDNSFATAKAITAGVSQTHSLHSESDVDYVRFVTETWATIAITNNASADIYLYDEDHTEIDYGYYGSLSTSALPPGTYYAAVSYYYTVASYTLSLTVTQTAPVVAAPSYLYASVSGNVITVTFDPVVGATGYKLYYDTDSGYAPFTPQVAATEGASPIASSDTSVTVSGLPAGRTYYFAATATVSGTESGYSSYTYATLPPAADGYESDNTSGTARVIEPGEAQVHSLHLASDVDYVSFTIGTTTDLALETDGPSGDTELYLYNSALTQLQYDDEGGNGSFSRIFRAAVPPGTYYAKVEPYSGTVGQYTLRLTLGSVAGPPTGLTAVAGDGSVTVSWGAVQNAAFYKIYFDDYSTPWTYTGTPSAEGASPLTVEGTSKTLTGLTPGTTYYFAVTAHAANTSTYSSVVSAAPNVGADGFEADNTFGTAKALGATSQSRTIHTGGDVDYVSFTLGTTSNVTLETSGTAGDTVLTLYSGAQAQLATDDNGNGTFSRLVQTGLAAGTYYAKVEAKSASAVIASYSLSLTTTPVPAAPTGVSASGGTGSITISWSAVSGATGYKVYYDDDDTNPPYSTAIIATQGASPVASGTTSLTLTGLPAGTTMHLAVTALNGAVEGAYSSDVTATPQ